MHYPDFAAGQVPIAAARHSCNSAECVRTTLSNFTLRRHIRGATIGRLRLGRNFKEVTMKLLPALAAAAAMVASTGAGMAADVTARDPQSVLDALTALGYRGTLETMDSGRSSISVPISGLNTFIDFYDCDDKMADCYTLLFVVLLDLKDGATLNQANAWNAKEITGRVSLDDNGDPQLDYAVSTFEGLSASVFEQTVKKWDQKIGDMKDYFHF
jgi:hypothetical protein